MRSECETAAELRTGPAYWLPWALVILSVILLRARIGVPGAPALVPEGLLPSLAVDAQGDVWIVSAVRNRGHDIRGVRALNPCIWRIDRWNRLRREVGEPFGGKNLNGALALNARLSMPYLLGFDGYGRLHFFESGDNGVGGDVYRVESGGTIGCLGVGPGWDAVAADGSMFGGGPLPQVKRRLPDGREEVIAGTRVRGYSGDGGAAVHAALDFALDLTVGADNSIYIADTANHRVRRVDPGGIITTVAGTGVPGYGGDGGPATAAPLNEPSSVGIDGRGRVLIADFRNDRLRRIETDGTIVTVAGCGVRGYSGNGGPAVKAMLMSAWDPQPGPGGEVFFCDTSMGPGSFCIRKMDARGMIRAVVIPSGAR